MRNGAPVGPDARGVDGDAETMSAWAAAAAGTAVGGVALVSRRLASTPVSGPMLLVAAGLACGPVGLDLLDVTRDAEAVGLLFEAALVAVLFTDAAGVRWSALRRDDGLPLRLLGVGLPLTMVLGAVGAWLLLPGFTLWELALVAVILAPTDAALGQPAIADPRVPATVRQGLNVESGLNDGIALPFFVVLLAGATGHTEGAGAGQVFALALGLSSVIGVAVGWLGAQLLAWSTAHGWVSEDWRRVPALMCAAVGYAVTVSVDGSGFITAWVSGLVFGAVWRHTAPGPETATAGPRSVVGLSEELGDLLASLSFFVFGAVLLGPALTAIDWRTALYAILSLTVVRMLPVAVALVGSHFRCTHRALHRLVRSSRPRVHRVRPADAPRRPSGRRSTRRRRRAHRRAQRPPARSDGRLGCARLLRVACTRGRGGPGPARRGGGHRPRSVCGSGGTDSAQPRRCRARHEDALTDIGRRTDRRSN